MSSRRKWGNKYGLRDNERRLVTAIDRGENPIEAEEYENNGPLRTSLEVLWQWKSATEIWRKEAQA